MVRSVKRQAGRLTFAKRRNNEAMHIKAPTTNAEPEAILPEGIGRSAVRCICASVSLSSHWFSAATPPAAREVPSSTKKSFAGLDGGSVAK